MLRINNLSITHDYIPVVRNVSLEVHPGEMVALVGANGAGKSSVAKAIAGLTQPSSGSIEIISHLSSERIDGKPAWEVARCGVVYVPEARPVFETLSVEENLHLVFSAIPTNRQARNHCLDQIYHDFPLLRERSIQRAGTLSGGQKRILGIARSLLLMSALRLRNQIPNAFSLLIVDEPTHGLHPTTIHMIGEVLSQLNARGISLLIVEQMATFALGLSARGYVMRRGTVVAEGASTGLLQDPALTDLYLGIPLVS